MAKILKRDHIKKEIAKIKKQDKTIVFANGCFDVIHVGHIRYLRGAKAEGDVLILGINSNKSIQKLKGKNRPVISEKDRTYILSSFEMVDYITIFGEHTAETLLKLIKPDVHAKGTDYTAENVPEKHLLGKYIKRIAIVGDKKTHSTKYVIQDIKNKRQIS
ncbi:adenylyltransferase/cytidyltransferase family protein [bacterium]